MQREVDWGWLEEVRQLKGSFDPKSSSVLDSVDSLLSKYLVQTWRVKKAIQKLLLLLKKNPFESVECFQARQSSVQRVMEEGPVQERLCCFH
jgi:hypothetical protein